MRIHADTLFTYDTTGRMVGSNEPGGRPAPRLFIGLTAHGWVVRLGSMVPAEVGENINAIVKRGLPLEALHVPRMTLLELRAALEEQAPVTREVSGPDYRFPAGMKRPQEVVQVTGANLDLVADAFPWLLEELPDWWPCFARVHDGAAVSICFSSRITDQACEAGVETLPDFRSRGFASAVTAAWAASIRRSARIPLYSTSVDNLASQGVAARLGLIRFGFDLTWR
jgi:RimJ/RimL family protein N-acetyltransferase